MTLEVINYLKTDDAPESGLTDWVQQNVYNPAANSLIQLRNGAAGIIDTISHTCGGNDVLGKADYYKVAAPSTPQEYVAQSVSAGAAQVIPYLLAAKIAGAGMRAAMPESVWESSITRAAGRGLGLSSMATKQLFQETSAAVLGAACVDGVKSPLQNETRLGNVLGGTTAFLAFGVLNPVLAGESRGIAGRIASRAYVGAFGGIGSYVASSVVDGKPLSASEGGRAAFSGATVNTLLPPLMHATTSAFEAGRSMIGLGARTAESASGRGIIPENQAPRTKGLDISNTRDGRGALIEFPDNHAGIDLSQLSFDDIFKRIDGPSQPSDHTGDNADNHDPLSLPYYPESGIEHQNLGPNLEQITPETRYRGMLHALRDSVRDTLPEKPTELIDRKLAYFIDDSAHIGEFMDAVRDKIRTLEAQQKPLEAENLRVQWKELQNAIPKELLEANAEPDHRTIGPKEEWLNQQADSGAEQSGSEATADQPQWDPTWGNRPGEPEEVDPSVWQSDKHEEPQLIYDPNEEPPGWHDLDHKEVGPPSEWLPWEERFKPAWKTLCEEVHNLLPENPTEKVDLRLKTFIDDVSHLGEFMDAVRDKIDALNMVKMYDEADVLEHWWKEIQWRLPQDYFNRQPEHRPIGPPEEWLKKPTNPSDKPDAWNDAWGEPPGKEQDGGDWKPDTESDDGGYGMLEGGDEPMGNLFGDLEPHPPAQSDSTGEDVFVPSLEPQSRPNYRAALDSLAQCVNEKLPQPPTDPLGWKLKFLSNEPSRVGDFMNAVREKISALTDDANAIQQTNANEAAAQNATARELTAALDKLSGVIPESVVAETTTK